MGNYIYGAYDEQGQPIQQNPVVQQIEYGRLIPGTEEPGFSQQLVCKFNRDENDFKTIPYEGIDTIWKLFQYQVTRIPNSAFLASRDWTQPGGPYLWKTWKQVSEIAINLSKMIHAYNLCPQQEQEGHMYKFMGIYSKNREEWSITELAGVR